MALRLARRLIVVRELVPIIFEKLQNDMNSKIKIFPKYESFLFGIYLERLFGDGPVREEADDAHARCEEEVDDLALVAVVGGEGNFSVK